MFKAIIGISLLFLIGLIACSKEKGMQDVDAQTFRSLIDEKDNLMIIDVRTPEEFAEGHIPYANNINVQDPDFKNRIKDLDRNQALLIYCRSGGRSTTASKMCEEMGFKEVYNLIGGFSEWPFEKE